MYYYCSVHIFEFINLITFFPTKMGAVQLCAMVSFLFCVRLTLYSTTNVPFCFMVAVFIPICFQGRVDRVQPGR